MTGVQTCALPIYCIAAEANAAVGEALPVVVPVRIAAPAVVDRVPRPARQVTSQASPGGAVPDGPVGHQNSQEFQLNSP